MCGLKKLDVKTKLTDAGENVNTNTKIVDNPVMRVYTAFQQMKSPEQWFLHHPIPPATRTNGTKPGSRSFMRKPTDEPTITRRRDKT